ncbi:MAG: prepilin peptidase [Caulobacteraceae bacterium]
MTHGFSPLLLLLAVFPAGVIVAALKDATTFTIPNWISAGLVIAFFPMALLAHMPLSAVGISLAAGFAALVAGIGMFAAGWCGGGDAKLLAASALWLGWPGVLPFLAVTGIAGGAVTLGLLAARKGGGDLRRARAGLGRAPPGAGRRPALRPGDRGGRAVRLPVQRPGRRARRVLSFCGHLGGR